MQEPYLCGEIAVIHNSQYPPTTYRDPLLLTDLASDVGTGPEVDGPEEMGQAAHDTTVTNCLGILPNDVTWDKPGYNAWGGGGIIVHTCAKVILILSKQAREYSISPK